MRRRKNHDWTIMSASSWISGKPTIEKIIKENGKGTIMVVERLDDSNYDGKPVKIFVLGAIGNYGNPGENKIFIKDTGSGYGGEGKCKIENIITINDKEIIDEGNGIGVNEKRSLWVFK